MGGCRCAFRDCRVSTSRNPDTHFFHFPQRDKLSDWTTFSGLNNFLTLPEKQRKNKVICGRHFKTECFMNYKQDRLVQTAVPTITRLSPELALDYEHDVQNPKLIRIEQPNLPHLIAPSNFKDPQCFNGDDLKFCADILELHGHTNSEPEQGGKRKRIKLMDAHNSTVLPYTESRFSIVFESLTNDETFSSERNFNEQIEPKAKECANCSMKNLRIKELEALLESKNQQLNKIKVTLKENADLCQERRLLELCLEQRSKDIKKQLADESLKNKQLTTQITVLNAKYDELLQAHNKLKEQHENLVGDVANQKEISAIKGLIEPLSKQQLFNGIKRYLSQTMVALLRMQLSSYSSEREWKPEEKRVAIDLLCLGQSVYKYFTDEWLIRLPGINLVSEWRNQIAFQGDEEEI